MKSSWLVGSGGARSRGDGALSTGFGWKASGRARSGYWRSGDRKGEEGARSVVDDTWCIVWSMLGRLETVQMSWTHCWYQLGTRGGRVQGNDEGDETIKAGGEQPHVGEEPSDDYKKGNGDWEAQARAQGRGQGDCGKRAVSREYPISESITNGQSGDCYIELGGLYMSTTRGQVI